MEITERQLKDLMRSSYLSGANDVPIKPFLYWVGKKIKKLEGKK